MFVENYRLDTMIGGQAHIPEEDRGLWGKREIRKDPIAVGITGNGERYLICPWGMDKLIPFERIKSRSWLYHIQNFGAAAYFRKILAHWCGSNASRHDLHRNVT